MDKSPARTASLAQHFSKLEDPRVERTKKHSLMDMLVIAVCGFICGVDSWVALEEFAKAKREWFESFLSLPNGIPSHDTFGRLFAALNPEAFSRCFMSWVKAVSEAGRRRTCGSSPRSSLKQGRSRGRRRRRRAPPLP
nr:ISAs1 family transposase [Vitiosangium sp. GDMCC 1.1324]